MRGLLDVVEIFVLWLLMGGTVVGNLALLTHALLSAN